MYVYLCCLSFSLFDLNLNMTYKQKRKKSGWGQIHFHSTLNRVRHCDSNLTNDCLQDLNYADISHFQTAGGERVNLGNMSEPSTEYAEVKHGGKSRAPPPPNGSQVSSCIYYMYSIPL